MSERSLPVHTLSAVCAEAADEPNWIWRGYLAPGAITLLAGKPKVGKSTLLFALFRALRDGELLLGFGTRATRVLMFTEERGDSIAEKARLFGLDGSDDLGLVYRHETLGWSWNDAIGNAAVIARRDGFGLLVVDTLNAWAGLTDDAENRAGAMLEIARPLLAAAGDGLAILVTAHQRKSSGRYGEAVRGSNALTGSVEIITELERTSHGGAFRELAAISRFGATPEHVLAELSEDGYRVAEPANVAAEGERRKLLAAVERSEGWQDAKMLAEIAEIGDRTARRRLNELADAKLIDRMGRGVKGDSYRYRANVSELEALAA